MLRFLFATLYVSWIECRTQIDGRAFSDWPPFLTDGSARDDWKKREINIDKFYNLEIAANSFFAQFFGATPRARRFGGVDRARRRVRRARRRALSTASAILLHVERPHQLRNPQIARGLGGRLARLRAPASEVGGVGKRRLGAEHFSEAASQGGLNFNAEFCKCSAGVPPRPKINRSRIR